MQASFIPQGILLDLDGTLVDETLTFSPELIATINSLQQHVPVALCTGRHYASLANVVLPLFSSQTVHILAGGGQLRQTDGTVLWESVIPSDRVHTIAEHAEELGATYAFGQGDTLYRSQGRRPYMQDHPWRAKVGELEQLSDWSTPLLSIVDVKGHASNYIETLTELRVHKMRNTQGFFYFDITAAGVEKATTITRWCTHYGFDLSQIVALGDNFNDQGMLEMVGYAVVVRTAPPEILALAQQVIGTPKEDGALSYLRSVLMTLQSR